MQNQNQKRGKSRRRKWLIGIILVLILLLGFYCWYTSRYSYLPEWYGEETPVGEAPVRTDSVAVPAAPAPQAAPPARSAAAPLTLPEINYQLQQNGTVRLPEAAIVALIRTTARQILPPSGADYLKEVRCRIHPPHATLEVIVDVANIPWDRIPRRYHYTRPFIEQLPGRGKTEVYFKLFGAPLIQEDYLTHSENATLTVGKVPYLLTDLFRLPFVFAHFNGRIEMEQLPFDDVLLEPGEVVLLRENGTP